MGNLPSVIEARFAYANNMLMDYHTECDNSIFADESPFNVCVLPSRGISLRGCRPLLPVESISNIPNVTLIAAMNRTGFVHFECVTGPVNGAVYAQFLSKMLAALRQRLQLPRRDDAQQLLIQDNSPIHKARDTVLATIPGDVRVAFLPPYSPFLDPL
eukprot:ANDGO_07450.mRNA.1 hypothetical protein